LILPALLLVISFYFRKSAGEYFLSIGANNVPNYDPAYVYLINSLNLAKGVLVSHIDHPGTSVQLIGALIIKTLYYFQGVKADIVEDVFFRPEFYLIRMNFIFVLLNSIVLAILGFVSFKKIGNIYKALFLQLTPFGFSVIYYKITDVTAEAMIVFSVILYVTVIISYIYENELSESKSLRYAVLFGLVCGFGMVSKILFFSLLIIPVLLIKKFSNKIILLSVSILTFTIIFYSAVHTEGISFFAHWILNLITHSGRYGEGNEDFIETTNMVSNLNSIFIKNPLFTLSYLLISTLLILSFFKSFKLKIKNNKNYTLLVGLFLTMTLHTIIVLKHFGVHYMIPVFLLSITGLFVSLGIYSDIVPVLNSRKKIYFSVITLFVLIFTVYNFTIIRKDRREFNYTKYESYKIENYIKENYNDPIVVCTYGCSDKAFALYIGNSYAGIKTTEYNKILINQFPNHLMYNRWINKFDDLGILKDIESKLIRANKFLFLCDEKSVLDNFIDNVKQITGKPNAIYKVAFNNIRGETVYEIILDPSINK